MAVTYVTTADPYAFNPHSLEIPKKKMAAITPGATNFTTYSLIYCSVGGTVTYLPALNDDAVTISETVSAGWVSPVLVRQVTAAVATVYQILD